MVDRKKQERMKQAVNRKRDHAEPVPDPPPSSDPKEDWIGRQLRDVYDKTLNEPIPDRLLDLLKQIDEKDSEGK